MKRKSRLASTAQAPVKSWSPSVRLFLAHLRGLPKPLDRKSIEAYRGDLEDVETFLGKRGKNLANPSVEDLNAYLEEQSLAGHSGNTVARRYAALRKYLKFLFGDAYHLKSMLRDMKRPRVPRPRRKTVDWSQIEQLLDAPDHTSGLWSRDRAILRLLCDGALEASELCELETKDVDLAYNQVHVRGRRSRIVPLTDAANHAIDNYIGAGRVRLNKRATDRLFLSRTGRPLERVALWGLVERTGCKQGLPGRVSPRILRQSNARERLKGGADPHAVQKFLGHSSIESTRKYGRVGD